MKNLFVTGLLLLLFVNVRAQDTVYFDKKWKAVALKTEAKYYRLTEKTGRKWIVKDYFLSNNNIQMEAIYSSLSPGVEDGLLKRYYENGNLKEEGIFKKGKRHGIFHFYYQDGKPESQFEYKKGKGKVLKYWDKDGVQVLKEGTGFAALPPNEKEAGYKEFHEHVLTASFIHRFEENDTIFSMCVGTPQFKGGSQAFYKFIYENLMYPESKVGQEIKGKIFVQFVVNQLGMVENIETVQGMGEEFDVLCEDMVRRTSGLWIPGYYKGKPVKVIMILPIKFDFDTQAGRRLHMR